MNKDIISSIIKLLNLPESIETQKVILELKEYIINLESENAELKRQNMNLKTQIADYNCWEKEKEKYETIKISKSTFVYQFKGTNQLFCPKCFNECKMPIHLRPPDIRPSGRLECPKCKSVFLNDIEFEKPSTSLNISRS